MDKKSSITKKNNGGDAKLKQRTKEVPVVNTPHYSLHIEAAKAPNEVENSISNVTSQNHIQTNEAGGADHNLVKPKAQPRLSGATLGRGKSFRNLGIKFWNTLEWLATSALIFMILFFALNYSSYSELFKNKLDKLRGDVQTNPYIEQIFQPQKLPVTQELLPITTSLAQSKKQIPIIAMAITPPDDRIIIPRINQNVPIVKVSTENLILRDWNALEKDIQKSLQDGVVHYPGTAEPGDKGNVVITGHSSYFPWDSGRFKDVFALLHQVAVGDQIIVYHNQKAYSYQVYEIKVVTPDKVDVLTQEDGDRLTLITCTPVGTNLRRLIVLARPVNL